MEEIKVIVALKDRLSVLGIQTLLRSSEEIVLFGEALNSGQLLGQMESCSSHYPPL